MYIVVGLLLAGLLFVVINVMNPTFVSSLISSINPRYGDYFEGVLSSIGTYLITATRLAFLYLAFLLMKRSGKGLASNWSN